MTGHGAGSDLLLTCLRARFGRAADAAALAAPPAAWQGLLEHARRHRVAPLVHHALGRLGARAAPPADVAAALRESFVVTALRNAALFRDFVAAVRALQAEAIDVMVLKGVHLAADVYADAGERGMADIDLMVRPDRIEDADRILTQLGYGPLPRPDIGPYLERTNHIAPFKAPGRATIEVHWTIERPTSPFDLPVEDLWRRARPLVIDGVSVLGLAPADLLIHLGLHVAYHHRFARYGLKGLCDVAAAAVRYGSAPDWDDFRRRAADAGTGSFMFTTLVAARDLLGAPVPDVVVDDLAHDPGDRDVVAAVACLLLSEPEDLPVTFQEVGDSATAGQRVRRLLAGVFPPPARLRAIYGLPPRSLRLPLYYLLRPADLLARRGRLLGLLLFRSRAVAPALSRERSRRLINAWVAAAGGAARADDEAAAP